MKAAGILCAVAMLATGCGRRQPDALPGFPRLILWAWERPEDLRFIDPAKVGVAYLAGTVDLRGGRMGWRPRLQPLRIPPGTKLMAVVRIESGGLRSRDARAARETADLVSQASRYAGVAALQIDYDARRGERGFYGDVVRDVRAGIPRGMPLTMTALVSWCASDTWIADLPVDAAVPMFFRMGAEKGMREARLNARVCRGSTGISTDELVRVPLSHRVFLFHPKPWTREDLRAAVTEVNRWK